MIGPLASTARYTGVLPIADDFLGIVYKAQREKDGALLAVRCIFADNAESCGHSLTSLHLLYQSVFSAPLLTQANAEADEAGNALLTPLPSLYDYHLDNDRLTVEFGLTASRSLSQYIRRHKNHGVPFAEAVLWTVAIQLLKALLDLYNLNQQVSLGMFVSLAADTITVYSDFQLQLGFGLPYCTTAVSSVNFTNNNDGYQFLGRDFLTRRDDIKRVLQVLNALSSLNLRSDGEVHNYSGYTAAWNDFLAEISSIAADPSTSAIARLLKKSMSMAAQMRDSYIETQPLFREIEQSNSAAVTAILQQHTHQTDFLEIPNGLGKTALDLAAEKNNSTVMRILCHFIRDHCCKTWMTPCRINPHKPSSLGLVVLHAAAGSNNETHLETFNAHCRQLLEDTPLRTSLSAMLAGENCDNVELLFCEIGIFLSKRVSHLSICALNRSTRGAFTSFFLPEVGINGFTSLMAFSAAGDERCTMHYLHEAKQQTTMGYTALMFAAMHGHLECVRLLLKEACISDNYGTTALMMAADNGWAECVEALMPCEAHLRGKGNLTPLMIAAQRGHADCVRVLLTAQEHLHEFTDSDYADGAGINALSMAALHGHLECVRLLTSLKDAKNSSGKTPIEVLQACYRAREGGLPAETKTAIEKCIDHLLAP